MLLFTCLFTCLGASINICVFRLQEINRLMDEKYDRCSKGEGNEKIGFLRKGQIPCTRLSVVSC